MSEISQNSNQSESKGKNIYINYIHKHHQILPPKGCLICSKLPPFCKATSSKAKDPGSTAALPLPDRVTAVTTHNQVFDRKLPLIIIDVCFCLNLIWESCVTYMRYHEMIMQWFEFLPNSPTDCWPFKGPSLPAPSRVASMASSCATCAASSCRSLDKRCQQCKRCGPTTSAVRPLEIQISWAGRNPLWLGSISKLVTLSFSDQVLSCIWQFLSCEWIICLFFWGGGISAEDSGRLSIAYSVLLSPSCCFHFSICRFGGPQLCGYHILRVPYQQLLNRDSHSKDVSLIMHEWYGNIQHNIRCCI